MRRVLLAGAGIALLAFTAVLPGVTNHAVAAKPPLSATTATAAKTPRANKAPKIAKLAPAAPAVPIPFVSACKYSHRGPDDPIVHPDMPGMSHSHDFFGNMTTSAASTLESLQQGGTTCSRPQDTAAYWVPTMMVDGQPVTPVGINAYYKTGRRDATTIQPFPPGLKIVAGNAKAAGPQSRRITTFGCRGVTGGSSATEVPTCQTGAGKGLTMSVHFPDCWNGHDLDSPDHMSHMAYSDRGVCPAAYPVPVPALTIHVKYDIAGGAGVTLASGPFYTAHADFFSGWNQPELTHLVQVCMNAQIKCGAKGDTARP